VFDVTPTESLAFRGLVALAFGILTLVWPGLTLTGLVVLFGVFVLLDGLGALAALIGSNPVARSHGWWYLLHGCLGVGAGVITLARPSLTQLALLYLIAAWALIAGAIGLVMAMRDRTRETHRWRDVAGALLAIVFGALLVIFPGAGALAITWLIGWWAVIGGLFLLWQVGQQRHEARVARASGATRPSAA
jgi:uncharacterized membrane protein HdeD (DUF308 family)